MWNVSIWLLFLLTKATAYHFEQPSSDEQRCIADCGAKTNLTQIVTSLPYPAVGMRKPLCTALEHHIQCVKLNCTSNEFAIRNQIIAIRGRSSWLNAFCRGPAKANQCADNCMLESSMFRKISMYKRKRQTPGKEGLTNICIDYNMIFNCAKHCVNSDEEYRQLFVQITLQSGIPLDDYTQFRTCPGGNQREDFSNTGPVDWRWRKPNKPVFNKMFNYNNTGDDKKQANHAVTRRPEQQNGFETTVGEIATSRQPEYATPDLCAIACIGKTNTASDIKIKELIKMPFFMRPKFCLAQRNLFECCKNDCNMDQASIENIQELNIKKSRGISAPCRNYENQNKCTDRCADTNGAFFLADILNKAVQAPMSDIISVCKKYNSMFECIKKCDIYDEKEYSEMVSQIFNHSAVPLNMRYQLEFCPGNAARASFFNHDVVNWVDCDLRKLAFDMFDFDIKNNPFYKTIQTTPIWEVPQSETPFGPKMATTSEAEDFWMPPSPSTTSKTPDYFDLDNFETMWPHVPDVESQSEKSAAEISDSDLKSGNDAGNREALYWFKNEGNRFGAKSFINVWLAASSMVCVMIAVKI